MRTRLTARTRGAALGLLAALAVPPASAAPMPGPAPPPRTADRVAAQAGCVGCHPDVAREWAASLHRRSASDEPYRAAFAREPLPFCRKCHVPENMPQEPASEWATEVGVGCVTCHVTGRGGVLSTHDAKTSPPPPLTNIASPSTCSFRCPSR